MAFAVALLIVPVVLAYSNIFNAEFVFDDGDVILGNPTLKRLWPPSSWQGYVSTSAYINQTIYTRPVAQFTFALNYALGGFTLWGYHAVSLAIHVCSTLLVFGILRRTLLTPLLVDRFGEAALGIALVASLLWGLHPLDTNAIAYISPRMEALMAMFYLLTLYCWIRGVLDRSTVWLALSVASCFLGMMSKEVMVTAPVMVFLYDGLFLAGSWRQALRQRWRWYIGLLLSAALLFFLVLTVPGEHGAFTSEATATNQRGAHSERWSYAATMPGVILYYLRLLVWPDPLVFDYKWPVAATWAAVVLPGIVVAGAGLATVGGLIRRQAWAYPIALYLVTLSPSSSLMPLYDDYIAEYRVYLPLIGPVVFVVCGAWLVLRKLGGAFSSRAAIGGCAGIALVCALGGLTWARNVGYRTTLSLWQDTAAKAPDNDRAFRGFGDALLHQGRYDEAVNAYRESLRLYPGNYLARLNLGVVLAKQGRLDESIEQFREILRMNPANGDAHHNIATTLVQQGHPDQALQEYQEALRLNPDDAGARKSMQELVAKQGPATDTTRELREAVRSNPNDARAYFALAKALADQGQNGQAIEAYQDVLHLDPHNNQAHNNLGAVYRNQGKLEEASAEFRNALQQNPADALAAFNLGSTLVVLGHPDEAIRALRTAARLAPQDVDSHVLLSSVLFQQGKLAEATEECREIVRLTPTSTAYNNLAVLLARQGDKEGGLKAFRQALDIDPGNADARNNLKMLETGTPDSK